MSKVVEKGKEEKREEEKKEGSLLKVLTVGDGDLSLSLALVRAYGNDIDLTASVLETEDTLRKIYPDCCLDELKDKMSVPVEFELDATQLHNKYPSGYWDLILFQHPHLGLATLEIDEIEHANRHHRLLCHYLYAAGKVSKLVHVCLCGNQPDAWNLSRAAERQHLQLLRKVPTSYPFARIWNENTDGVMSSVTSPSQPHFAAPRRYRNGKLGSRHFLGKYGYKHRRTEGELYTGSSMDMNVEGSEHFVFGHLPTNGISTIDSTAAIEKAKATAAETTSSVETAVPSNDDSLMCSVCGAIFESKSELENHKLAPAKPQVDKTSQSQSEHNDKVNINSQCDSINLKTVTRENENNEQNKDVDSALVASSVQAMPLIQSTGSESNDSKQNSLSDDVKKMVVPENCENKRLRWFIQHNIISMSKRLAEDSIKGGLVQVNDECALDSSRILKSGDKVLVHNSSRILQEQKARPTTSTPIIDIIRRQNSYIVVWKTVGIRTRGYFPGTLENNLHLQEGSKFVALSKLDTACPGLCVLVKADDEKSSSSVKLRHKLVALVYGIIPDTWLPRKTVDMSIQKKWNKRKRSEETKIVANTEEPTEIESIELMPLQRTSQTCPVQLSTIQISLSTPSTSTLCYLLRQEGFPVVGDQFCRQEYLTLKRSIRNRIKDKLCIGCYEIELDGTTISKEIPEKLSANFWQQHCTNDG